MVPVHTEYNRSLSTWCLRATESTSVIDDVKLECELGIRGYQGILDNCIRRDNGFIGHKIITKNSHFLELNAEGR